MSCFGMMPLKGILNELAKILQDSKDVAKIQFDPIPR
jgi:hypothetical protein